MTLQELLIVAIFVLIVALVVFLVSRLLDRGSRR
jgi:hypothetical protein